MSEEHTMQCMEVWGGNQPVDCGVVMAGLDAWVYSQPFQNAQGGGDVHYVSSCATGRITRLLLADVSGHGVTVSTVASNLRNLMRRFVNFIDQTKFVRKLNEQFTSGDESTLFATAIVTTFFAPENTLSVCNAGHPPPFVFQKSTGRWAVFEKKSPKSNPSGRSAIAPSEKKAISNTPLGIIDLAQYEQFSIRTAVGDMVLCYTDSLIECRDPTGAFIGVQGLLKCVRTLAPSNPAGIIPNLLQHLRSIHPDNLKDDDVSALLFRINGLAQKLTLGEKLRSLGRTIAAIVAGLNPGGPPIPWPEMSMSNLFGAMDKPADLKLTDEGT